MRIGVIGGGSIGLLYAYYLNQIFSVTIYTRTVEQADKINKEGIWLKKKDQIQHTFVLAAPFESWEGTEDITFVTVKQYQLAVILETILEKNINSGRLLFLQNGMGHIKYLDSLPNSNIYVGSIEHGAYRDSPNMVHHNGEGVTRIAVFKGEDAFLKTFASTVNRSFPIILEPDYYNMLVRKLVVNAVVNPLTAILQVSNGELLTNPHYYKILQNVFAELTAILQLENKDEYFNHIINVCQQTAQNRSSMLKDLENNQATEVDAILGYLIDEAENRAVNPPLVRTFYHLVKGKEHKMGEELDV